jgi:hypothetical protein
MFKCFLSTSNRTPAETMTIENRLRRAAKRKGYPLVRAASSDTTAVVEPGSRGGRSDAGSRFDELVGADGRAFIGGTASGVPLVSPG